MPRFIRIRYLLLVSLLAEGPWFYVESVAPRSSTFLDSLDKATQAFNEAFQETSFADSDERRLQFANCDLVVPNLEQNGVPPGACLCTQREGLDVFDLDCSNLPQECSLNDPSFCLQATYNLVLQLFLDVGLAVSFTNRMETIQYAPPRTNRVVYNQLFNSELADGARMDVFQSCTISIDGIQCNSCQSSDSLDPTCSTADRIYDCSNIVAGDIYNSCNGDFVTIPVTSPLVAYNQREFRSNALQVAPTFVPTSPVTTAPSSAPSSGPTQPPSSAPSSGPTAPETSPPTIPPTSRPTGPGTSPPTFPPTSRPTSRPTSLPTSRPTSRPTTSPTQAGGGTMAPTPQPVSSAPTTSRPTNAPTRSPTRTPTNSPTTSAPTTNRPTFSPSASANPTLTRRPTPSPLNRVVDPTELDGFVLIVDANNLVLDVLAQRVAEYIFENLRMVVPTLLEILVAISDINRSFNRRELFVRWGGNSKKSGSRDRTIGSGDSDSSEGSDDSDSSNGFDSSPKYGVARKPRGMANSGSLLGLSNRNSGNDGDDGSEAFEEGRELIIVDMLSLGIFTQQPNVDEVNSGQAMVLENIDALTAFLQTANPPVASNIEVVEVITDFGSNTTAPSPSPTKKPKPYRKKYPYPNMRYVFKKMKKYKKRTKIFFMPHMHYRPWSPVSTDPMQPIASATERMQMSKMKKKKRRKRPSGETQRRRRPGRERKRPNGMSAMGIW